MEKVTSVAQVRAVVLESGATVPLSGRVQKAVSYLVEFQALYNHPGVNAKCSLNFAGEDAKPVIEAAPFNS